MAEIAVSSFIPTCAGVGVGWRRIIVNINISAGDDCPGEWRKAAHDGVSFCRVVSDDKSCPSASFSTNGTSYQRVRGCVGDTRREILWHFMDLLLVYIHKTIDEDHVSELSITYGSDPH